jgi:prepilin-type N-terminal cleavage/methylation domain-containing protein
MTSHQDTSSALPSNRKSQIADRKFRAFTLIELLVVIGIIVLVVLIAIPVLNVLQGNRSIEGAQNQIQALLNEARMMAIGVQRDSGVMFYIDHSTQRVHTVLVQASDRQPGDPPDVDVMLDLIPDHESVPLTVGLSIQVIDNATVIPGNPPQRSDDGYIGFNTNPAGTTIQYGGVILFDLHGQLVSRTYGFRTTKPTTPPETEMSRLIFLSGAPAGYYIPGGGGVVPPPQSKFGFVLFNAEPFSGQGFGGEDAQSGGGGFVNKQGQSLSSYSSAGSGGRTEAEEESWIDSNSIPFMVNRYNGTLTRGE